MKEWVCLHNFGHKSSRLYLIKKVHTLWSQSFPLPKWDLIHSVIFHVSVIFLCQKFVMAGRHGQEKWCSITVLFCGSNVACLPLKQAQWWRRDQSANKVRAHSCWWWAMEVGWKATITCCRFIFSGCQFHCLPHNNIKSDSLWFQFWCFQNPTLFIYCDSEHQGAWIHCCMNVQFLCPQH